MHYNIQDVSNPESKGLILNYGLDKSKKLYCNRNK